MPCVSSQLHCVPAFEMCLMLKVRASIAALRLDDGDRTIELTISIGVACAGGRGSADSPSALLSRADRALYQAKAEGRNRVVRSEERA